MSKIICDICGTKYPDTAEQCPICGYSNTFSADEAEFDEDIFNEIMEEAKAEAEPVEEPKQVPAAPAVEEPKEKKGLFGRKKPAPQEEEDDEDEDDEDEYEDDDDFDDDEEDDEYDDDDDDDDDDEDEKGGTLLNILLVIVIIALLCVSGFIFVKYFLPSVMSAREAATATEPIVTEATIPEETEAPTVPCVGLDLTEKAAELNEVGQKYLIGVVADPADTTDMMHFVSADETIATVDEEGCITAVGNGTTIITITCGAEKIDFVVSVDMEEDETEAPSDEETTESDETTSEDETTATEETEVPEESKELRDVKLEIDGNTDVTFRGKGLEFTFKLKNGLKNNEVTWKSENANVCTIDDNGHLVITGKGRTDVVVTYGEQEVRIIVRATWE